MSGTTAMSSSNLLEVNGAAAIGYTNTAAPTSGLLVSGKVGVGTTSPNEILDVWGTQDVESSSASAFTVGANGATNPAFAVNASTASVASGIVVQGNATGVSPTITTTDSGTNSGLTINTKGNGQLIFNQGTATSANGVIIETAGVQRLAVGSAITGFNPASFSGSGGTHIPFTVPADLNLTASTNFPYASFNGSGVTRQHATGALALQTDYNFGGTIDSFVGTSTETLGAAVQITQKDCGTSGTCTSIVDLYIPTYAYTGTVTNGYGLYVAAPTAATNNYAAYFGGSVGIGTTAPATGVALDLGSNSTSTNSSLLLPVGTSGARPTTGVNGMIRYNSSTPAVEAFVNGSWSSLGGSISGGIANYVARWTGATSLGTGTLYDTGSAVGIGTSSPTAGTVLDVTGTILDRSVNAGSATSIDWSQGNAQYTTASCGAFTFTNMTDGGSYSLAVEGTTSGTCSFVQSGLTFKMPSNHGATTAGTMTFYAFLRLGSLVFVTWNPGY